MVSQLTFSLTKSIVLSSCLSDSVSLWCSKVANTHASLHWVYTVLLIHLNLEGIEEQHEKRNYHESLNLILTSTHYKIHPALFLLVRGDVSADNHLCGCSLDQCWSPAGQGHSSQAFLSPRIHSEDLELLGLSAVFCSVSTILQRK